MAYSLCHLLTFGGHFRYWLPCAFLLFPACVWELCFLFDFAITSLSQNHQGSAGLHCPPRSLAGYRSSASSCQFHANTRCLRDQRIQPLSKRSGSFTILSSAPFKQKPGSSWIPRFEMDARRSAGKPAVDNSVLVDFVRESLGHPCFCQCADFLLAVIPPTMHIRTDILAGVA